jgi:deoxyribonuclease V
MDLAHLKTSFWQEPASWEQAAALQKEMAASVCLSDAFEEPIAYIAGLDVSCSPLQPEQIYASAVLLRADTLEVVESQFCCEQTSLPYRSGFLAFREVPALSKALLQLKLQPQLIMVDGHGLCHPRGLGIASHLGVLLDKATIGVGKSLLVGQLAAPLGLEAGAVVDVVWRQRLVAKALRSKVRCNPLIVSAGHRISLDTALSWVKRTLKAYRLPEPTRQAHLAANRARCQGKL